MPATSFSGDCFWRRSARGRAGSPSKSRRTKSPASFSDDFAGVWSPQGLAQVVVAMDANALTGGRGCGDGVGASEEVDAPRKQQRGIVGDQVLERGELQLQGLQGGGDLRVDAARVTGEVFGREGLGGERGVIGWGGKGEVHFGGAAAKKRGCLEAMNWRAPRASRGGRWSLRKLAAGAFGGAGRAATEVKNPESWFRNQLQPSPHSPPVPAAWRPWSFLRLAGSPRSRPEMARYVLK